MIFPIVIRATVKNVETGTMAKNGSVKYTFTVTMKYLRGRIVYIDYHGGGLFRYGFWYVHRDWLIINFFDELYMTLMEGMYDDPALGKD